MSTGYFIKLENVLASDLGWLDEESKLHGWTDKYCTNMGGCLCRESEACKWTGCCIIRGMIKITVNV